MTSGILFLVVLVTPFVILASMSLAIDGLELFWRPFSLEATRKIGVENVKMALDLVKGAYTHSLNVL